MTGRPGSAPRDRRVVLLIGLLVATVLVVNVASALVPGIDGALASLPVVGLILVLGTFVILARSIRGRTD